MEKNTQNGKRLSVIATVEGLTHDDKFPTKRQLEFKRLNGDRLTVTDLRQFDGWQVGNLLKPNRYGSENLREEARRAKKIVVVGFYSDKAAIQLDGDRCICDYVDELKRYLEVAGIDEKMATDINAVNLKFDDQIVAAPLPDFKVKNGDQVLLNTITMQITRSVRPGQTLVVSRARLNPRSIGNDGERLEREIKSMVIGQDQAIAPILSAYQKHCANLLDNSRPAASVLMLGPTGTGKTRTAEALAECLLKDRRAVIKIDCAEFQHSHEIAKLIGSPPGYLGHRETHPLLSQEVLNQYHRDGMKISIVLFDEIEKASDSLWNLMLGILDKATLTLGDNRRVDFSNSIILCTSNLGANDMVRFAEIAQKLIREGKSIDRTKLAKDVEDVGLAAARSKFSPEFINRFDKIVSFVPLMEVELLHILDIELGFVRRRVEERHGFTSNVADSAKKLLLDKGTDMRYGARELKRTIEQYLTHPLANLVVSGQVSNSDCLNVVADGSDADYPLAFETVKERLTERAASGD